MKITSINGKLAWAIIAFYILKNKSFKSISGITYEAKLLKNAIEYTGGNRNGGTPETIVEEEFISNFDLIKSIDCINTNTIKDLISNSLYRKRTPFIGLLNSSGIIN